MSHKLHIEVSEQTGLPYAVVPSDCMWDLVEYLSYQRIAASYEYRSTHFTVCFLHTDRNAAQRLLDEWGNPPAARAETG